MEVFASEFMEVDELVIKSRRLKKDVIGPADNALHVRKAISYRCTTTIRGQQDPVTHLFVVVRLANGGTKSWMAEGATLTVEGEELPGAIVWQAEPISQGGAGMVVVRVEVTAEQALSTFTLTLRDTSGRQPLTLENVRFP